MRTLCFYKLNILILSNVSVKNYLHNIRSLFSCISKLNSYNFIVWDDIKTVCQIGSSKSDLVSTSKETVCYVVQGTGYSNFLCAVECNNKYWFW